MNPQTNPYAPGAGTPPPELAGRDSVLADARTAIQRKAPSFAQRFTEVSILADLFLDKDNKTLDTFSEAGKSIFVAACLLAIQRDKPTLGEVNRNRSIVTAVTEP